MAKFYIKAQYEYEGEVEADTAEEAEQLFLDELDTYYAGTYEYECEELESEDEDEDGDEEESE
jgi:hypothetical protein